MNKNRNYLHRSNEENNKITRESIEIAILLLLKKKNLSAITITELVSKAGVSRNSFYRNYASKEDVIRTILEQKFEELAKTNVERYKSNRQEAIRFIVELIYQEWEFFQIILSEGCSHLLENIFYQYQPDAGVEKDTLSYYRNRFVSGGAANLLIDWLQQPAPLSPEKFSIILSMLEEYG